MVGRAQQGDALFAVNMMPSPVSGYALERRLSEARRYFLASDQPLTLRALGTFEPGVLWSILRHLEYLPEPEGAALRMDKLLEAKDMRAARVRAAQADGREDLVALATEMYNDEHARLMTTARDRTRRRKAESNERRRRVLQHLRAGLPDWTLVDLARLVIESAVAWQRPPCPTLAGEYAGGPDDPQCSADWLADRFRQDLKR